MKLTENRGIVVVLGVFTLIVSVVFIGMLATNQNFDNDRVNGHYIGNINVPNQSSSIVIDITFDGEANCAGTISLENQTLIFSDIEYICQDTSVQFSFYFLEEEKRFTFIGEINEDNSVILGEIRYYEDFDTFFDGSFYISKV